VEQATETLSPSELIRSRIQALKKGMAKSGVVEARPSSPLLNVVPRYARPEPAAEPERSAESKKFGRWRSAVDGLADDVSDVIKDELCSLQNTVLEELLPRKEIYKENLISRIEDSTHNIHVHVYS